LLTDFVDQELGLVPDRGRVALVELLEGVAVSAERKGPLLSGVLPHGAVGEKPAAQTQMGIVRPGTQKRLIIFKRPGTQRQLGVFGSGT
jgi:hypothetical protein